MANCDELELECVLDRSMHSRNTFNDHKSNVGVRGNASICSLLVVLCETDKTVRMITCLYSFGLT